MVDFGLWSCNGRVVHRGNDEDLGEMLSKVSKPMFFCFGHNLVISSPNGVIQIAKYTRLILKQTP